MFQLVISQKMQWTYSEYMSNPKWYLELLKDTIILEAQTDLSDKPQP